MPDEHIEILSDEDSETEENSRFTYKHSGGVVELNRKHLRCLRSGSFLTDNIIQFYCAYLMSEICPQTFKSKIHIFDSLLFEQIDQIFGPKIDEEKFRHFHKWYDRLNIFEKDFLIFPVCKNSHWLGIVVCHPSAARAIGESHCVPIISSSTGSDSISNSGSPNQFTGGETDQIPRKEKPPAIIVLDSLGLKNQVITSKVRDFLDYGWRAIPGADVKRFAYSDIYEYVPSLPRQKNDYDCGLYLLMYIKSFVEQPDTFYKLVRKGDYEARVELRSIIKKQISENRRQNLKDLIHKVCNKTLVSAD